MPRRTLAAPALALAVAVTAVPPRARAQDVEEPDVQVFDPLVTRKPMPERELEVSASYEKGREGRELETEVELSWRFGRAFSISLEVPVVYLSPPDAPDVVGIGDIALDARLRVFQSVQHAALVSVGFELGLPTGAEHRDLGGSTAATPYVTAGIGLGPIDLIGEVAYTWIVDGADSGAESFQANLAAAYTGWRRVTPLLELNLVTQTRGRDPREEEEEDDEPSLVGRTPGVPDARHHLQAAPANQPAGWRPDPAHQRQEFDYRIIVIFNWEF
jgi:hypothetical protein